MTQFYIRWQKLYKQEKSDPPLSDVTEKNNDCSDLHSPLILPLFITLLNSIIKLETGPHWEGEGWELVQCTLSWTEHRRGISITSSQQNLCRTSLCFDPDARAHAPQFIQLEFYENKAGDVSFGTLCKDNKACA